jgi:hypothetical protein
VQIRKADEPQWADVKIEERVLWIWGRSYPIDKLGTLEVRKAGPPSRRFSRWFWDAIPLVLILAIIVISVVDRHDPQLSARIAAVLLVFFLIPIVGILARLYTFIFIQATPKPDRYELVHLNWYTHARTGRPATEAEVLLHGPDLAPIKYIQRQVADAINHGQNFFAKIDLHNVYGVQIGDGNQQHNAFHPSADLPEQPGQPRNPVHDEASQASQEGPLEREESPVGRPAGISHMADSRQGRDWTSRQAWAWLRARVWAGKNREANGTNWVNVGVEGNVLWIGSKAYPVETLETRESASLFARAWESIKAAIAWALGLAIFAFFDVQEVSALVHVFCSAFVLIAVIRIVTLLGPYFRIMRTPTYEFVLLLSYRDAKTGSPMIKNEVLLRGPDLEALENLHRQVIDAINSKQSFKGRVDLTRIAPSAAGVP